MILHHENHSLKDLHTFGLDVKARHYLVYHNEDELKELLKGTLIRERSLLLMGGGSNLLFLNDYNGVVLHSAIDGIEVVEEDSEQVLLKVGAGVAWDALVAWSVERGYGGIENLSYIPGDVGAAPVQNIGAYGVEFQDVFVRAEGYFLDTALPFSLSKEECAFGYRDSIFKKELKGKVVVTRVLIRLSKQPHFLLDYGPVRSAVEQLGSINLHNIRKVIIAIRCSKLPDPKEAGNAGSFFKNPVVPLAFFQQLQATHPDVPHYELAGGAEIKIPAGWLIEQAGWKGRQMGRAAVHSKQALVLVNLGGATGKEIYSLAENIRSDVQQKYGILLEPEVNVLA